jgi:hypothetical protein
MAEQNVHIVNHNLADYITDYAISTTDYLQQSQQLQQEEIKQATTAMNAEYWQTNTVEEKALVVFTEAIAKPLKLSTDQVFNWHAYFTTDDSTPPTEEEVFRWYFELPSFVIQYALVCIRLQTSTPLTFQQIIQNAAARTKLLQVIDIVWKELSCNRGAEYISKLAIQSNHILAQSLYQWFQQNSTIKPDENWNQMEHRVFPLLQTEQLPYLRTIQEDFLALVAQACFVEYSQAFEAPTNNTTYLNLLDRFRDRISVAAYAALQLVVDPFDCSREQVLETILKSQITRILFAKLISNYYAQNQVLNAQGAMNKDLARIRTQETKGLIAILLKQLGITLSAKK